MDLNVCSRRVHDGYATIRSRGRSRPRAVYRSDSEELLKEAGGPYALPRVSNSPLSQEHIHQVPRWSDSGTNKLLENYGTLRRGTKSTNSTAQDRRDEKIILNTFSSSKNHLDKDQNHKNDVMGTTERLYDTVPSEDHQNDERIKKLQLEVDQSPMIIQNAFTESLNDVNDTLTHESTKKMSRRRSDGIPTKSQSTHGDKMKSNEAKVSRSPIYAVPNAPRLNSDNKFDSKLSTDGNYVPSGDLYRTTARYIEDINRNIAEIDKSYEELRCSTTSNPTSSAYGVINKIPRSSDPLLDQSCNDEFLYSSFHRKRDTLAPMPPISPNFGENGDDRLPGTPIFLNERDDCNQGTRFDFKIPRNHSIHSARESVRARPNSYGKLPPKLLPRSSSIENNSSRHSTGSTTTSSSTKSTESLYAISESLTELQRDQRAHKVQSPRKDRTANCGKKSESYDNGYGLNDVFIPAGSSRLESKVDNQRTRSQIIVDDPRRVCCHQERSQISWNVDRNRSCSCGDSSDLTGYGKSTNKINCGNSRTKALDSTSLREKDMANPNSSATSQSQLSRQERKIVDLDSEDVTVAKRQETHKHQRVHSVVQSPRKDRRVHVVESPNTDQRVHNIVQSPRNDQRVHNIVQSPRNDQRVHNVVQSSGKDHTADCTKKSESYDNGYGFNDVFVTTGSSKLDSKVDNQLTRSQLITDDSRRVCCHQERSQINWNVGRNRCCSCGDTLDVTGYGTSINKINCGNSRSHALDSTTLREKDQSSCYVTAVDSPGAVANTNSAAASQSRSSRQERKFVDLESEDDEVANRQGRRRTKYEKTMISERSAARSGKDRSGSSVSSSSTGTIRRNRCSSRTDSNEDYEYNDVDDDDEIILIGKRKNDRRTRITSASFNSQVQFCDDEKAAEAWEKRQGKQNHPVDVQNTLPERRYGTLPYRKSKNVRALHKSSEDVLDCERSTPQNGGSLQRSFMSTVDVRAQGKDGKKVGGDPFYLMDATDVILKGQFERKIREKLLAKQEEMEMKERGSSTVEAPVFAEENETLSRPVKTRFSNPNTRTRHNSLESDDVENSPSGKSTNEAYQTSAGGFATLPRRGNISKEQRISDTPRRLSGNVPVLEPLYEHAVSDPVKPRGNDNNVIPWWELATRKYRHRSCPALQDHVVQAFEQSLSNMNQRLKQLTATAEKKDSELQELRDTIERLRKQSAEAGLNGAASNGRRHTLGDSDTGTTGCTGYSNHQGPSMARQLSADSVTSLNSLSSACSASSHRKKKGWLGSFSKKFSRSRKNRHGSVSDAEDCKDAPGELSAPNSPRLPTAAKHDKSHGENQNSKVANGRKSPELENPMTGSKSSSALYKKEDEDVDELKEQLRQKDLVLAEITLEALSLKDEVYKMKNQMNNLKQNNERLQQLVTSKSLTSSQSSLPNDPERRFSVAALSNGDHHTTNSDQMEDLSGTEHTVVPSHTSSTTASETVIEQDTDGKRINVAIYLGSQKSFNVNLVSGNNEDNVGEPPNCVIASVCISNKTTWDALDSTVRRCFKEYVTRVDPVTNLGLGVDYVAAYHLGEASRFTNDSQHPELLPCGYLIGHVKTIYLVLSGYSWLAIDTLIPKSIVQRLVSLLTEHRRLILCGPSGTGKSYLAGKLAHALVDDDADVDSDSKDAAAVATFNVDHKSSKDLTQYLAHIADTCDSNAAELPKVIILENLQHAASLGELFSGLLGTRHSSCPAIIGTMSQSACSTTNLQLHHNFRWVLCRKDMEPVKGFLGRYLRRKLLEHQLRETVGPRNAEMAAVVEWLPRVWLHLNKFLETHSGSDVTIGPNLFVSCPMEVADSQVWFADLWNYSIIPYLVEAVKEGNAEAAWEDPAQFITSSYPWIATHAVHGGSDALRHLRPEDVGYDVVSSGHNSGVGASSVRSLGSTHSDTEGDPLLNMLMRLQEAANYSSPHSNDSDSVTSMDSSHTRHSEDLSTSTSSSRGVESAL